MTDRHEAECARVEAEFNGTGGSTPMVNALDEAAAAVFTAAQLATLRGHDSAYDELRAIMTLLSAMADRLEGDHGNTTGQ